MSKQLKCMLITDCQAQMQYKLMYKKIRFYLTVIGAYSTKQMQKKYDMKNIFFFLLLCDMQNYVLGYNTFLIAERILTFFKSNIHK